MPKPLAADRLLVSDVATFVGVSVPTVRKRYKAIGSVAANGWRVYTVADACEIFRLANGRKPTAVEAGALLVSMGLDDIDIVRANLVRLDAAGLIEGHDLAALPAPRKRS